jgi:type II secretory pathway component PulF
MGIDPLDEKVTAALRAWQTQHGAGLDVARTLESCAAVCPPGEARECFLTASKRTADGIEELLKALQPALSVAERSLLRAGWKSGRVEQALAAMARRRELWAQARRRMRSGMLLPLGVLLLASLVGPLPGLIADGSFAWYLVSALAPLAVAFLLWRASVRFLQKRARLRETSPSEAVRTDRILLGLPIVGEVERQRNLAEFADLLGLLCGAGVALKTALEACALAAPSSVYWQEIMRCAGIVGQGQPLSSALRDESLWPAPFVAAVVVGEKSGSLDETLLRLGNEAREEYGRAVGKFSEWLPRIAYCVVALFVILQIARLVWTLAGVYREALQ